ncbi:FAD-binding and (Fe-S)-binding domain-containing protein [Kocuria marina]|uniref:D-lactate dehydrogenase (cytochrome) n=1 Tax=Kocuria marina subsp. indica TaxID=1049583 RepID=A0A1X7CC86_9MICC|nr:FAD-binding and (Fe-S)-binding domain-containing protein [Kocuria indica]OXS85455.1 FAD-binding oxidoreductase [Kocuria indica]RLP59013.1 FAD-binding oxidoreductase [Kocuria indica]SME93869.1 D-lactate dehydrogenase [Kocuria indica]
MAPIRLPLPTLRPDDAPAPPDSPLDRAVARIERECGSGVVVTGELERRAVAHDASHYLMQPRAVLRPRDTHEVGRIFAAAADTDAGLTLRSGGTSLSGQSVTDQILVDVRRHFKSVEVLDRGARVRVQPGVTVRQVNARLAPHGRALGPDPASESACTLGGVVADNSSGMACGTEFNTYRTLESMVLVLPSGTVLDTAAPDAGEQLRAREPDLFEGLLRLRDRVRGNPESVRTIQRLFAMKNTMGYGLNSFLDHKDPVAILEHLMIGSEGTLGFVASATLRTVPVHPHVATGLLVFPTVVAATSAVPDLVGSQCATLELMDATSLAVSQRTGLAPPAIMDIPVGQQAALLVEYQHDTAAGVRELAEAAASTFDALELAGPVALTTDPRERASLWTVRKGLYTTVAGNRPQGTNALLEDVVVPVDQLGGTCEELTGLFDAHGYRDSVIFGHAKDGNVHFMLNEQFDDPASLRRYEQFTEEMVELILGRGGSLKAEHGTGRIMAPFVRRQYGDELYSVMVELKALIDPGNRFNPGVILTEDPRAYLRDLKTAPAVEEEVDRCVECGYCEPVCPSRDLTLTPRQRIVGRREIADAEARGEHELAGRMRREFDYDGLQTCAVDGMCVTACPVDINTGDLVRRLRSENRSAVADLVWAGLARAWPVTVPGAAFALSLARRMPAALPVSATSVARAALGTDTVPRYSPRLPAGGRSRAGLTTAPANVRADRARAVFFPACIGAMFGTVHGEGPSVSEAFLMLCERAGVDVHVPEGITSTCCGTPWKSKGLPSGYETMSRRTLETLWEASEHGTLPVVCDASSCTEGLVTMRELAANSPRYAGLRFVDAVQFVAENVLDRLTVSSPVGALAVHPTCSSVQLGINDHLLRVAGACAEHATVPFAWGCCGYAGDRGMLHPELTAAATAPEAAEVQAGDFDAYASLNRTCEQGMTEATGKPYEHVLQVLERVSR